MTTERAGGTRPSANRRRSKFSPRIRPSGAATVHECRHCRQRFRCASRLMAHEVYAHRYAGAARGSKLPCPICSRLCRSQATMSAHLGTHLGELMCRKCGAEFASIGAAVLHDMRHSHSDSLMCGLCRQMFRGKAELKEHRQSAHTVVLRANPPPESVTG
ncbi:zinc finger protein Gfi-1b-like [Dermacentor albipictus]|uniref:zinc finger protein Gfi-1b-like n=1 Tax=Dermacentor albipictus TaxID=60249 RepID=UPI0038FD2092